MIQCWPKWLIYLFNQARTNSYFQWLPVQGQNDRFVPCNLSAASPTLYPLGYPAATTCLRPSPTSQPGELTRVFSSQSSFAKPPPLHKHEVAGSNTVQMTSSTFHTLACCSALMLCLAIHSSSSTLAPSLAPLRRDNRCQPCRWHSMTGDRDDHSKRLFSQSDGWNL